MAKINDGGPAFPLPGTGNYEGMSLRALFAGMAMQGIAESGNYTFEDAATDSVRYADALIAELKKEETE